MTHLWNPKKGEKGWGIETNATDRCAAESAQWTEARIRERLVLSKWALHNRWDWPMRLWIRERPVLRKWASHNRRDWPMRLLREVNSYLSFHWPREMILKEHHVTRKLLIWVNRCFHPTLVIILSHFTYGYSISMYPVKSLYTRNKPVPNYITNPWSHSKK